METKNKPEFTVKLDGVMSETTINVMLDVDYGNFPGVSLSDYFMQSMTGIISNKISKEIRKTEPNKEPVKQNGVLVTRLEGPFRNLRETSVGAGYLEFKFHAPSAPEKELLKIVNRVIKEFNENPPSVEDLMA